MTQSILPVRHTAGQPNRSPACPPSLTHDSIANELLDRLLAAVRRGRYSAASQIAREIEGHGHAVRRVGPGFTVVAVAAKTAGGHV